MPIITDGIGSVRIGCPLSGREAVSDNSLKSSVCTSGPLTITSRSVFREIIKKIKKNTFGLDVARDAMVVSLYHLDDVMRRES